MKTGKIELDAKVYLSLPLLTTDGTLKLEVLILYPNGATLSGTLLNIASSAPFVLNALPRVCDDEKPLEYSAESRGLFVKGGSSPGASGVASHAVDL